MSFKQLEILNLVRNAEQNPDSAWGAEVQEAAATIEVELSSQHSSLARKASDRAVQLAAVTGLGKAYQSFKAKTSRLVLLFYSVFAVLGLVAVFQTINSSGDQINVYWLLLILLGINLVSMLIWIVMLFRGVSNQSPILAAYQKLLARFSTTDAAPLFQAWSDIHVAGRTGTWNLSKHLHACWLMYLVGGLIALLLALSGKQINFVWGTTIMQPEAFAALTHWLGALPNQIGFEVPDHATVLASVQGASEETLSQSRKTWASFVVGSLLVYAIAPRLLLWILSNFAFIRTKSIYQPDWELPYFYGLRARLLPERGSLGVVDHDSDPRQANDLELSAVVTGLQKVDDLKLPESAYVAAFEWGSEPQLKLDNVDAIQLDRINDINAQTGLLQAVQQSPKPLILITPLHRAADRGAARFFSQIMELAPLHLVVVRSHVDDSDSARWAGWQNVAERIGLAQDNISLVQR